MGQTALSDSVRAIEAEIAAGRPDRALALCQDAQAAHPRALAVLRVMGEVYLAMRKTREAVGALDRALAGNPEDARACCARAIVQQIQGDSMGALAWYRRACDTRPDDTVLRSAYRELATSLGQPAYTPTRMGLARLYLRGDLFPHAIREFETLLAEQPDALEAQVGLAETFWRAHRPQAAAECCRRILVNAPSCLKALLLLAQAEQAAGNDDEAQRLVKRAAELDPDVRMGQELFADQLAAGDFALRTLLFGPEPPAARVPSLPLPHSAAPDAPQPQPPVREAPSQQPRPVAASQPLYSPPMQRSATESQPLAPAAGPRSHPLSPAASTQPRPTNLPPDFHTIFAETEYMLWGREEETMGRVPAFPGANGQQRPESFGGSVVFMPPALQQQGGPLDDTEARAAINYISWLQAQGALPQGGPQPGMRPATGPLPPPPAGTGPLVPPPTGPLPWEMSASYAPPRNDTASPSARPWRDTGQLPPPPPTGPLPLPTPEALRQMFAELEPEPSNSRIVDGSIVVDSVSATDGSGHPPFAANAVSEDNGYIASDDGRYDAGAVEAAPSAEWDATWDTGGSADAAPWSGRQSPSSQPTAGYEPAGGFEQDTASTPESPFAAFTAHAEPAPHDAAPTYESSWSDSQAADMGWTLSEHLPETFAHLHDGGAADDERGADADLTPAAGAAQYDEPPLTLEALERGFTSSGFQTFDLHPGGLASFVAPDESVSADVAPLGASPQESRESWAQPESVSLSAEAPFAASQHDAPPWSVADVATGPLDVEAPGTEPLAFAASQPTGTEPPASPAPAPTALEWGASTGVSAAPAPPDAQPEPAAAVEASGWRTPSHPVDEAAPAAVETEPPLAPDDYAARLARARQRRSDGRLDDALAEYRILLKSSPDLLSDVMGDLRDSLAEQPEHPELHRLLGDAHIRQGDYLSALESYNRAVALTQAQGN